MRINRKKARLNIYLPDPAIRREIKSAAAKRDISASEYCLHAIVELLDRDGEHSNTDRKRRLKKVLREARRFQAKAFGRRVLSVNSADLIREARSSR